MNWLFPGQIDAQRAANMHGSGLAILQCKSFLCGGFEEDCIVGPYTMRSRESVNRRHAFSQVTIYTHNTDVVNQLIHHTATEITGVTHNAFGPNNNRPVCALILHAVVVN